MTGMIWKPDPGACLIRRWGRSPHDSGDSTSSGDTSCPDIWELDNGDVAVIGVDMTATYRSRLPSGASVDPGESLVVIPRSTILGAKADIPDE
jgi:hypothetical protein